MDAHFLLILLQFFLMAFIFVGGQQQDSPPKAPPKRRLKVLVYSPSLSWSHAQFLGQLADTLQAAGHEVHFLKLLSEPNLRVRNETRLVQRIYRVEPKEGISEQLDISKLDMIQNTFAGNRQILTIFDHPIAAFGPNMALMCQEMIENTELLNRLAAEHFDVGIAELYDPCPAAILHRIGVRTKVAAFAVPLFPGMARQYGIPSFASYMPNMMAASSQTNFWMRAANFINEFYEWAWMDEFMMRLEEPIVRRAFGSDFPPLKQLARNVSLAFFNSNPFFELPRPISSKIIHIGGIVDQQKAKGRPAALDSRTQHILDNARAGAILFSFGSIADTRGMGAQMRGAIRRAFARFPEVQFLWKLDASSSQNDSAPLAALPNVHIFDWVRQSAVLSHPNLRAFISHCGQNSLSEAARAGVPVIGIPLFGDQPYNSLVAVQRGMATQLDVGQLNGPNAEAALVEALRKILHEPSYAQNARLIQRKLALTPFSPIDRFVRWVEFAAEFPEGLEELNLPGDEQIHWFVYYSLDVILASFAGALALCWAAWKIMSTFLRQTTFVVRRIADQINRKKLIKCE